MALIVKPQVRDRWTIGTLSLMTPARILEILRGVIGGSFVAQWELFDLMEDTWPRLKKNLNELKNEVQKIEMIPTAFSTGKEPSPLAVKKKEVLAAAISAARPNPTKDENSWEDAIYDACDAVGKGISVQEIIWSIDNGMVLPRAFQWLYPRHYGYWVDKPDLQLCLSGFGSDYIDFPPDKFVIATFKTKSGHVLTSPLLRSLATMWIGANFSYDWALNLAQMFGIPIRWATYDPTNPKLLDEIADMLENMGSAGWGAFPSGTTLELKEGVSRAADNPQNFLMELADIAADILILGQTLTTTQGARGALALGRVHQDVRSDRIAHVAKWAARVMNYQFVPALMRLNFGNNDEDPYLIADVAEPANELEMAERDQIIVSSMQVPVREDWFYERHDIPKPAPDDKILVVPQLPAPSSKLPSSNGGAGGGDNVNARLQAKSMGPEADATSKLIDNVLENLTGVQARWLGDVKPFFAQLLEHARSNEVTDAELMDTIKHSAAVLPELFSKLKTDELEMALYNATSAGLVNGVTRGFLLRRQKTPNAERPTSNVQ